MSDIDLSKLPNEAKKELIDFYEFLILKYSENKDLKKEQDFKFEDFYLKPIKVDRLIKSSRESLHER